MPTYEFVIEGSYHVKSVAGPGLTWKTVLQDAVRDFYVEAGASQARWVRVTGIAVNKGRTMVRTSRGHVLTVEVTPWQKPREEV